MCSFLPVKSKAASLAGNGFLFMGSAWDGHTGAVGVQIISRSVKTLDLQFVHITNKQRKNIIVSTT